MNGLCSYLQGAFFQLPAGSQLQIALISRDWIEQLAIAAKEQHALELITSTNSATSCRTVWSPLKDLATDSKRSITGRIE